MPFRQPLEQARAAAAFLIAFTSIPAIGLAQGDPFAAGVRPTNALTPEQEQKAFHLPPGFTIQLFAAEPDIQKPLNMAFDARGRLWVTCTVEYPFPVAEGTPGRDSIRILEDTDHDGRADKTTVFADGLNIPIGLYPYKNGVIAFSIPYIYLFDDTDGDGKADKHEILYGPLDYKRDTHGLNNAFRRGFDGWLYANHGFNNDTTLRAKDGSQIHMASGNTYRVRTDGSRVEQFTFGQVNPFGSTFDPSGDLFTADCHTRPIMLLLRGGWYDSFGRPHNGLGYVPGVMEHFHGSTAIAGTVQYNGANFPREFHGNMFSGNVMTSRVNRDSLRYFGSSPKAIEEPDFISTDDPWFRPVDLQIGPDGALYIADFYNKIIGHYEVPLSHPGRDRHRGRIWRVAYVGDAKNPAPLSQSPNLRTATIGELIAAFDHPVLTLRMRAADEVCDRVGAAAIAPLRDALAKSSETQHVHILWCLYRLDALRAEEAVAAAKHENALVRVHAMRLLGATAKWDESQHIAASAGMNDADPLARRAAVDALGLHPVLRDLSPLVALFNNTPETDVHLRHKIRMTLLELIQVPGTLAQVSARHLNEADSALLAGVALALPNQESGAFLVDYLRRFRAAPGMVGAFLTHAAKHLPADVDPEILATLAQRDVANDIDLQLDLLLALRDGLRQRRDGAREPAAVKTWGANLTRRLFESVDPGSYSWTATYANGTRSPAWKVEPRKSADGVADVFLSSLTLGETYTGTLRSRSFTIPDQLSFYICGHLGFPDQRADERNFVRLRRTDTGEVVARCFPPRNDVATKITWDLKAHAGKPGVLEVIDGLDINAFAWLAVSRFEPPVVQVPRVGSDVAARRLRSAAQIAAAFDLRDQADRLRGVLRSETLDPETQAAAARALLVFEPDVALGGMLRILADPALDAAPRGRILRAIVEPNTEPARDVLAAALRSIPARLQAAVAEDLSGSPAGAELLLALSEQGVLSARTLQTPLIHDRILAARPKDVASRLEKLTADLPPIEAEVQKLIDERRARFSAGDASASRGREVFTKNCAACHQVGGQGVVLGPQLDGVGTRGMERLVEDILDPSRNVDPMFYSTLLVLKDGRILSGLLRRREGNNLVLADAEGKEFRVAADDIEEQRQTRLSPMPTKFGSLLAEAEMYDLIAFLLGERSAPAPVTWRAVPIDKRFRSEGVAVMDVNRDGKPDIVAGEVWYEAPAWTMHEIATPGDYGDGAASYSKAFLCFAGDFNNDGWSDVLVIDTPGVPCHWFENPKGQPGHWKRHLVWTSACNETPLFVDLFSNGRPVLVMAFQPEDKQDQGQMAWFAPGDDATKPWTMHPISAASSPGKETPGTQKYSHGLGAADVNGDGRRDVICTSGWWEHPANVDGKPWPFHPANLGEPCAHMHTIDIDHDGSLDVVSSSAHAYGIWAHLQRPREGGGDPAFERVDLFPRLTSQTHALLLEDMDGDGLKDLVTGKRFWAHGPKGDVGSDEPAVLYWLRASRAADGKISFTPYQIHNDSGVGLHFAIADVNGDRAPDVVVSNKKGVFLFEQVRPAKP